MESIEQYKEIGEYLKQLTRIDYSDVINEDEYVKFRIARFMLLYKYINYYRASNNKSELIHPQLLSI